MAFFSTNGVGITGICACVPKRVVKSAEFSIGFSEKEVRRMLRLLGSHERRFADDDVCASDLSCRAAEKLLTDLRVDRNHIDVLIFLSQNPDYFGVPPTAPSLQYRLGLSKATGAFDLGLNCSGFIYALSNAFAYAECGMRVLLLVGETMSKRISAEDWSSGLLFGDGGAALLIESNERFGRSCFDLNSDGSGMDIVKIPAGGYRNALDEQAFAKKTLPDGSRCNDLQVQIDGNALHEFRSDLTVPAIQKLLAQAGMSMAEIDYLFQHQTNRYAVEMAALELGVAENRSPISIDRFGNTSTVSIPLGMVADFGRDEPFSFGRTLFFAYGAGMSWGSCITSLHDCYLGALMEFSA